MFWYFGGIMQVHNIQEEKVKDKVNSMYKQVKEMNAAWLTCDCEQCKLDTTTYVLNRLPPRYIVSGRGLTYSTTECDIQLNADIDTLVIEAMKIVASVKRPYHDLAHKNPSGVQKGPSFNFPTFIGSCYDGTTFEPLKDVVISLSQNGKECEMIDYTWANPQKTEKRTKGSFCFWVKPRPAKAEGENVIFTFSIDVRIQGYDPISYAFDVPVISEKEPRTELNSSYSLKIQDFYLLFEF